MWRLWQIWMYGVKLFDTFYSKCKG